MANIIEIKKGKIANALTSAAKNHIVATTDDLYDMPIGLYQEEINSILSAKTEALEKQIHELSAATVNISAATVNIDNRVKIVSATTANVDSKVNLLSAVTANISASTVNIDGRVKTISATTNTLNTEIHGLSGATIGLSGATIIIEDKLNKLSGVTVSGLTQLSAATIQIENNLSSLSGYAIDNITTLSSATITIDNSVRELSAGTIYEINNLSAATISGLTQLSAATVSGLTQLSGITVEIQSGLTELSASTEDLKSRVETIESKIPEEASSENQLADKEYVDDKIAKSSSYFRGNWATWDSVPSGDTEDYPVDPNGNKTPRQGDYIVITDVSDYSMETGMTGTWRFAYTGTWEENDKDGWLPEYRINEEPEVTIEFYWKYEGEDDSNATFITQKKVVKTDTLVSYPQLTDDEFKDGGYWDTPITNLREVSGDTKVIYIIPASYNILEDNNQLIELCHENGWCNNPEYMSMDEMENLTND